MACTMSIHAYPLGSDLRHACSTVLLMPFIGSLLPTTTLMRSTTWMIFFLWGQQVSNNVPPQSKSHSQFAKRWVFLLPLRNWRDHQHKSPSWGLSWIRRLADCHSPRTSCVTSCRWSSPGWGGTSQPSVSCYLSLASCHLRPKLFRLGVYSCGI